MDANTIAGFAFLTILIAGSIFLYKKFRKKQSSKVAKYTLIASTAIFFVSCAFASPQIAVKGDETKNSPVTTKQETTKEEKTYENITFETQNQDDSTLAKGNTKVKQEGQNGQREKTWKLTFIDGIQTNKVLVSEKVVKEPTPKIILNGTYVAPPPPTTIPTGNGYYNVDGNYVSSPVYAPSAPAGATARCADGTYSFSQHRRGTCSYHGGVAEWL